MILRQMSFCTFAAIDAPVVIHCLHRLPSPSPLPQRPGLPRTVRLEVRERKRARIHMHAAVDRPVLAARAGVLHQQVAVAGIIRE